MQKVVLRRLSSAFRDSKGRSWQINVAALVNRNPLLTKPLEDDMGFLLDHNLEHKSRASCMSDWEISANSQDQMIKDKAAGKITGDLPFANSKRNIKDELNLILEDHLEKEMNFEENFYLPYEQLTMISNENGKYLPTLPITQDDTCLVSVAEKAVLCEDSSLAISFTSPYPVGHYTLNFGKKLREEKNVQGIKVFVYHGYVRNRYDPIDASQWVPSNHFENLRKKSSSKTEKKILKEIMDCL